MPPGLDTLQHLVVLMMENRSFDHMLGALKAQNPSIDGLDGTEWNPDTTGKRIQVQAKAKYQGQLDPDPNHDFGPVNEQIFNGTTSPDMKGFIRSYFKQRRKVDHSHRIMYYFKPNQLPVLTTLATEYVLFNRWFASIPGPTLCNRAFAHYGTSFGHVGMEFKYFGLKYTIIYERLIADGQTTKLYYFDRASSTLELVNLLENQPQIFSTYEQFLADCHADRLPVYSFVEPNYSDHDGDRPCIPSCVAKASVLCLLHGDWCQVWQNALLITGDEYGGLRSRVAASVP